MNLALNETERSFLLDLLRSAHGDLRVEVRRTSTPEYHDGLREQERMLHGLIERLDAIAV